MVDSFLRVSWLRRPLWLTPVGVPAKPVGWLAEIFTTLGLNYILKGVSLSNQARVVGVRHVISKRVATLEDVNRAEDHESFWIAANLPGNVDEVFLLILQLPDGSKVVTHVSEAVYRGYADKDDNLYLDTDPVAVYFYRGWWGTAPKLYPVGKFRAVPRYLRIF